MQLFEHIIRVALTSELRESQEKLAQHFRENPQQYNRAHNNNDK